MNVQPLSDEQWIKIQGLMDWTPPLERGTKRTDLRKIWNSIFHILCYGCRWSDLPYGKDYATKTTAFRWLKKWEQTGVLDRVLGGLLKEGVKKQKIDLSHLLIDGSFSPSARRRRKG